MPRFDFARQQVRVSTTYIVKQGNRIEKAPKDGDGRVRVRVRELYREHLSVSGADGLAALAAVMAAEAGLDEPTALSWLTEFASAA